MTPHTKVSETNENVNYQPAPSSLSSQSLKVSPKQRAHAVKTNSQRISNDDDGVYKRCVNYLCPQPCSRKSPNKMYLIVHNLFMPFFVIATVAFVAYLSEMPFIFPSLGPTAFLHFAIPNKPPSSPKNTLIGHLVGILSGSLALQVTNLYNSDVIFIEGVVFERIFSAALSVGLTCCLMIVLKVEHPPAGATTLIVSLGMLKTPFELLVMMLAVLLLTVEAFVLNRLCRTDAIYPFWSVPMPKKQATDDDFDPMKGYTLRGFSDMRLSNMNLPRKKLDNIKGSLELRNFIEYFKICTDIGSKEEMRVLLQFAKENRDEIKELNGYYETISFAARVLIQDNVMPI